MSETSVEVLTAKQAITEVLYHYCRGLDRMDRAMALSVWHPDGTADYGEIYQGTGHGFVEWVWHAHAAMAAHSHQITNVLIDVYPNGDRAVSEAYVTAAVRTNPQDGHDDRLRRPRPLPRPMVPTFRNLGHRSSALRGRLDGDSPFPHRRTGRRVDLAGPARPRRPVV